ncbi:hypothetical protein HY388_00415 [Candidatus Daviesbacteria bacterium]|nr:hypothetical protein [Candidatus Daviesbacteria bacterium]
MELLPVKCDRCKKIILRSQGRINEGKKFDWNIYCSLECISKARNKQKALICTNPSCGKIFKRQLKELKNARSYYCSRSCAATINNSRFPKRHAVIKMCGYCNKEFKGREKYCSKACKNAGQIIVKEIIIEQIQSFYKKTGRIPLKREFSQHKAARLRFGSWNAAIIAAGFNPNPVKYAKKYIANDGHKCDSLTEKIIDDWFYARKILHDRNIPYGKDNMTADFKVNGCLIEFFGLKGEVKAYDALIARKKKFWQQQRLNVISIYPKDLFPNNKLDQILKFS